MAGIAQFFIEGGIWMAPIGFLSILVLAVVVDRAYYLLAVYSDDGVALMGQVRSLIQANQLEQAIKACEKKPDGALSQLFKKALQGAGKGNAEEIQMAIAEGTSDVVPLIQKRSHTLAGLASLATLLGLLGTVMGLIEAFTVVADAPPDQKSVLLTKAISVAMNCTAFGLIVSIPAMFFQLLVSGSVKKILDDVDSYSLKLENLLISRLDRPSAGEKR